MPGGSFGQDRRDEIVDFGRGGTVGRWVSRALLAGLVLAAAVTIAIRAHGHEGRTAGYPSAQPHPVRVTAVGHRLLSVTGSWQLLARGPDDLLQIQLARGRITQTYVPPLESANPDVEFVVGAHATIIRSFDLVPGYIVPEGGQARRLTGALAHGGPLVPGPAGGQAAWVTTGPPNSPVLSLVTLTGRQTGPVIRFPPGGPLLPATAISDGRGDVLVASGSFTVYDAGPSWDRPVPGTVVAIGPASWLIIACDPQDRHCRDEVIDTADGSRRVLAGPVPVVRYPTWPPTGVIAPDGAAAAVAETGPRGRLTVHLIDLRAGATRDLGVPLSPGSNEHSMAWSPDSRWLFVAAARGELIAVDTRTGRAESLGITLPAVDQVAIRA